MQGRTRCRPCMRIMIFTIKTGSVILSAAKDDKWQGGLCGRPETLLSSQFLPSRLQLAQALLLARQLLTLFLNHLWPGPGNKGLVRELALNARNLLLCLGDLLVETFQLSAGIKHP